MNLRNRTGTEQTDHDQLTLDRERSNTPGAGNTVDLPKSAKKQKAVKFSTTAQMENCEVCGGSFVKGRGLSIHQTKAGCRLILESRKSKHKSTSSGLQDLNHSDSTKLATFQDNPALNDEVTSKFEKTPQKRDSLLSNQKMNNTQSRSEDHEERFVERENSKEIGPIQEERKHPEVKVSESDA